MDTNLKRQENNLSYTNTFTKGMNTDVAYDFVSNNLYLFGKNIRIINNAVLCEEPDANNVNGVVAPVPYGKTILLIFKDVDWTDESPKCTNTTKYWTGIGMDEGAEPERILAVKTVDNIGAVILKYKDGKWRVFKVELTNSDVIEVTYIYTAEESTSLDRFSIAVNKETTNLTKLYIADGKHSIMIINLTDEDLSYYDGLSEEELSPNRIFPDKSPVFVDKITGTLLTSQVLYAYRLYKKHCTCSKMSPLTHKIQVISNSRQTDIGNEEDTQSSIGFRLRLDIKPRHARLYDKVQLYRVSYITTTAEPKCELIWDAKFEKEGLSEELPLLFFISDNGLKPLEEYTVDEFNQLGGLTVVPQLIDYNLQYMFAADITDESVIKIPDTELNMQAYSANAEGKIRLYSSQVYGTTYGTDYKDFTSVSKAAVESNTFYINKYVDMSLGDEYYNLDTKDCCIYIPNTTYDYYNPANPDTSTHGIYGGEGPNIEWRFIVRKTPIHENIYDKHFAYENLYTELPSDGYIDDLTSNSDLARKIAASIQWGYAKEVDDALYSDYIVDVPKVTNNSSIQYSFLANDGSNIVEYSTSEYSQQHLYEDLNDDNYLTAHKIEVTNRVNSYDDVFTSSMFRSLLRGETYRYGIVFFNNKGNRTDAKWIADIRIPSIYEFPITQYDSVNKILYANTIGVYFKVKNLSKIILDFNITHYEIVRCKKSPEYSRTLFLVSTSRPLSQKQFTGDDGQETTYYPYYASPLLTTDPYQIGYRTNSGQGRDYASASEVNNYHRGTDNTKHQLDFLQLFSPEILYRREDSLDILSGSNVSLHTLLFYHPNFSLNDYDVIFRCKRQYYAKQLDWYSDFSPNNWKIVDEFTIGKNGVHNRCIEYGQCLFGPMGQDHENEDSDHSIKRYKVPNIKPSQENMLHKNPNIPNDKGRVYMHPHVQMIKSPFDDNGNGRWYNLPREWENYLSGLYALAVDYVYESNSGLHRNFKDTCIIDMLYKLYGTYASSCDIQDFKNGIFLSGYYLVIGGILKNDVSSRLRMYTPYPILNRAYIENNKDTKQNSCYVFKDYYSSIDQNYEMNKWAEGSSLKNKYKVTANTIIPINAIADVQNPLWEDGYDDVELSSSIVDTVVKKYKTYLTSVGNKTYCNWSACGLYNWRAGLNDTVSRILESYDKESWGMYKRILHFYNPSAEVAKDYKPGNTDWGEVEETGRNDKGGNMDFWTCPSYDLRWNNGWFGPGPVCFLATLDKNLGQMDFEYGQFMSVGMGVPLSQNCGDDINDLQLKYSLKAANELDYSLKYTHAYFSSFGTWICNIVHNAINFEGVLKENKYYDTYLSFSNIVDIDQTTGEGSLCVFDGDTYILPCEFTSCFKTYNNNAASSTLNSQQFVYYIPMETKINVCFDYGKNYRNTINPNLQLEEGDMEGVVSQDRPLHLYNYIYSDNNRSIREYSTSNDEAETTHVEHRIIYSEPKTNGEQIDSWNTFKAANFIDADSHYGKITNLFTVRDIIHFWQTRAFGRLIVNERSLVTDENLNQITLGTGGVVLRTDYISTNYGMKQYDMCVVNAEDTVFWVDRTNNIFAAYNQGKVGSVGELCGVLNLINHLIDQTNLPTIHYDINSKEVIAQFLCDGNVVEQLVYNTRANVVTAVYTRDYDNILEFNNVLYGLNITDLNVVKYNFLKKDDVKEYLHPARLSFLVNVAPDTTKVFDNQKIVTAKRESHNNSSKLDYDKNYMLNKKYTFTTDIHQSSWNQGPSNTEIITDREGNILYPIPRYGDNPQWGNRLNGKWMKVDLDMMLDYQVTDQNDQTETKYRLNDDKPISQIITKFRRSYV